MSVRSSTRCVRFTGIALGLLLTAWAPAAAALSAVLTATVHLRAGPSVYYPSVALMPADTPLDVVGCEEGYDWCDVQAGVDRGWVDATFLSAAGPGGQLVIASNAAVLGVPTVSFVFNTYWADYYPGRPWYGRRNFYYNYWNRYPHGRPPPRPRPLPVRPPQATLPPAPPPGNTRPQAGGRPPGNAQPPADGAPGDSRPPGGSRPPSGGGPPSGGRPPDSGKPPGNDRPPPRDDQSRPEPRPEPVAR